MFYIHIFVASIIYYLISALWFSPLLAGRLWMRLLNWDMNEIQNVKMTKIQMFCMYFSGFLAGIALSVIQAFFLGSLFKDIAFGSYLLLMIACLVSFLFIPTLPNYLFKSYKLGISLKQAAMLWIVEIKAAAIGTLAQAFYLYFML